MMHAMLLIRRDWHNSEMLCIRGDTNAVSLGAVPRGAVSLLLLLVVWWFLALMYVPIKLG